VVGVEVEIGVEVGVEIGVVVGVEVGVEIGVVVGVVLTCGRINNMSYWYEPKKEDMDITEDGKEVHIVIDSDDSGNIYVSLKVKDLKDLLK
jgi:hypothetical protein